MMNRDYYYLWLFDTLLIFFVVYTNFITTSLSYQKFPWLCANFASQLQDQKICQQGEATHTKKLINSNPFVVWRRFCREKQHYLQHWPNGFLIITAVVQIYARALQSLGNSTLFPENVQNFYIFLWPSPQFWHLANCVFFSLAFQVNFHFLVNSYKMVRNVVQPQPLSQIQ